MNAEIFNGSADLCSSKTLHLGRAPYRCDRANLNSGALYYSRHDKGGFLYGRLTQVPEKGTSIRYRFWPKGYGEELDWCQKNKDCRRAYTYLRNQLVRGSIVAGKAWIGSKCRA